MIALSVVGDGHGSSPGGFHPDHSVSYSLDSLASSFIGNEINETDESKKINKYELPSYSSSIHDNSFSKIESFTNRMKKNFHKKKAKNQIDLIKSIESYEKALEFCLKTNDNASAAGKLHVYIGNLYMKRYLERFQKASQRKWNNLEDLGLNRPFKNESPEKEYCVEEIITLISDRSFIMNQFISYEKDLLLFSETLSNTITLERNELAYTALHHYLKGLSNFPLNINSYLGMAKLFSLYGMYFYSIPLFKRCIDMVRACRKKKNPKLFKFITEESYTSASEELAKCYLNIGNYKNSVYLFKKALSKKEFKDSSLLGYLAISLFELNPTKNRAESLHCLKLAITNSPDLGFPYACLAFINYEIPEQPKDDILDLFISSLEKSTNDPIVNHYYSKYLMNEKRFDKAFNLLRDAYMNSPPNIELYISLSKSLELIGQSSSFLQEKIKSIQVLT
ncbi:predicted protein [Naegleria gruberi]|uniref:Predicted protein n=1 Tax=Naegleria gruberi TaxID=5762 RepID=D2VEB6_NAEGR|nr:uncharacterized protein NAEGRDRAFT_67221 [Naegleria gruberi]EFC44769.1 predicted protein [Naegleria gruberi]|eukprot:XP_002677513.1 predicted protein [Naegleria gruberi strain NEG-M]